MAGVAAVAGVASVALERRRVDAIREDDPGLAAARRRRPWPVPAGADGLVPGHAVHHAQRRLLPDRHGAVVPADQPVVVEGRHRRDGGRRRSRLSYDDLSAMPQVERIVTLTCVSNEVGGDLDRQRGVAGRAARDVLDQAGVDPAAEQVFSTSIDGFTCGFPVGVAIDGRDAMIALGMNGEPLPLEHGFPARLVVPGLYGYVSATKWLRKIELNRWSDAEGYWVPLGWSRDGPIKTAVARSTCPAPRTRSTRGPDARSPAWPGPSTAASPRSRCASTTDDVAARPRWPPRSPTTRGGSGGSTGTRRRAEHTIQVRATDKTGDDADRRGRLDPTRTARPATTPATSTFADAHPQRPRDVSRMMRDDASCRRWRRPPCRRCASAMRVERIAAVDHRAQRAAVEQRQHLGGEPAATPTFSSIGRARSVVPTQVTRFVEQQPDVDRRSRRHPSARPGRSCPVGATPGGCGRPRRRR